MKKTLSSLLLSGLCVGMTFGVRAGDEKPAPTPAAPDAAPAAVAPAAAPAAPATGSKEIPTVDLKVLAPATFKELDTSAKTAINESDMDVLMHSSIRRLATSGWKEAQTTLIDGGKASIPYLVEALGDNDQHYPLIAFNLGGHIKADSGRGTRERTLAEACVEVLTEIVANHTDYAGEIPSVDQKAWKDWWTANAGKVKFGN